MFFFSKLSFEKKMKSEVALLSLSHLIRNIHVSEELFDHDAVGETAHFYKRSNGHIGLFLPNNDSLRVLAKSIGLLELVTFDTEANTEWRQKLDYATFMEAWTSNTTVWACVDRPIRQPTYLLGLIFISALAGETIPDSHIPLFTHSDECYFFETDQGKGGFIGLCLPDMDCLRESAEKHSVDRHIYFDNHDPVYKLTPCEWVERKHVKPWWGNKKAGRALVSDLENWNLDDD
jgi:hypothetical protein